MSTARLILAIWFATLFGCASHPPTPPRPVAAPTPVVDIPAPPPTAPRFRLGDGARPVRYEISLEVDPGKSHFSGVARIEVDLVRPASHLWLHGAGLAITAAFFERDTTRQPITWLPIGTDELLGFDLAGSQPPGRFWLEIAYTGTVATEGMSGLFRQKLGDDWYLYSQFEPTAARRAFPCFDEPGFKVPWHITVRAPRQLEVLSNSPVAELREGGPEADTRTVVFAPTRPLSSYLVAIAVGPFELVDAGAIGRHKTPVRIAVPRGHRAEAAHAVGTTRELLERFEQYFDLPYPYPKLDHVVVPRFFGAMENPGLITYDARILLTEESSPPVDFQVGHANVVAHEIAHMWFGDLVTLAWWNDIWLNESFATWIAARIVAEWQPDWAGELAAAQVRDQTMQVDSLIHSRRIRQPVDTPRDLDGLFDAISYGKGGAVLWMFERWLGPAKFREGVQRYLRDHVDATATSADFLAALAAVASPEIVPAVTSFLDQPGVPLVTADLRCDDAAPPTIALSQARYLPSGSRGEAAARWRIPVCIAYDRAKEPAGRVCTLLVDTTTDLELSDARGCPTWVMANAGGVGYYRSAYSEELLAKLLSAGPRRLSVIERLVTIDDVRAMVTAGRLGAGEALALVPKLLRDRDRHVVASTVALVTEIDANLVPARLRANYARFIGRKFGARARKLGWTARPGDDPATRMLRSRIVPLVATSGEHATLIRRAARLADRWLTRGDGVDDDMLAPVLATAARYGDVALRRRMFAALADHSGAKRQALILGLASFRAAPAVTENLVAFAAGAFEMREAGAFMTRALADPISRQLVYDFVKQHIDEIVAGLPVLARGYVVIAASGFCDLAHRDDAAAFFTPRVAELAGGPHLLVQTLEQIELCAAARAAQEPSVTRFLERY